MLASLVRRIHRARKTSPDLVVLLKDFEEWCRAAGYSESADALDALRHEGAITSYRIQSGRIKLFFPST